MSHFIKRDSLIVNIKFNYWIGNLLVARWFVFSFGAREYCWCRPRQLSTTTRSTSCEPENSSSCRLPDSIRVIRVRQCLPSREMREKTRTSRNPDDRLPRFWCRREVPSCTCSEKAQTWWDLSEPRLAKVRGTWGPLAAVGWSEIQMRRQRQQQQQPEPLAEVLPDWKFQHQPISSQKLSSWTGSMERCFLLRWWQVCQTGTWLSIFLGWSASGEFQLLKLEVGKEALSGWTKKSRQTWAPE